MSPIEIELHDVQDRPRAYKECAWFYVPSNGLPVVLVRDPRARRAACCIQVSAGSACEPADAPGLAHYVEHAVFLGSVGNPRPDGFMRYVSELGGSINAWTMAAATQFMFALPLGGDDGPGGLFGDGLQQLCGMLREPLWPRDRCDAEIDVIDSEWRGGLHKEARRSADVWAHLLGALGVPDHPETQFRIGNSETLRSCGTYERARAFWNEHYHVGKMRAVVVGPLPLRDLAELIAPSLGLLRPRPGPSLSPSPSPKPSPVSLWATVCPLPLRPGRVSWAWTCPVDRNRPHVDVRFPVPHRRRTDCACGVSWVAHVMGHEGPGSLASLLREQGLVHSVLACQDRSPAPGWGVVSVQATLTTDGERRIGSVVVAILSAADQMTRHMADGPTRAEYESLRDVAKLHFVHMDRVDSFDLVSMLGSSLHQLGWGVDDDGLSRIFSYGALPDEWCDDRWRSERLFADALDWRTRGVWVVASSTLHMEEPAGGADGNPVVVVADGDAAGMVGSPTVISSRFYAEPLRLMDGVIRGMGDDDNNNDHAISISLSDVVSDRVHADSRQQGGCTLEIPRAAVKMGRIVRPPPNEWNPQSVSVSGDSHSTPVRPKLLTKAVSCAVATSNDAALDEAGRIVLCNAASIIERCDWVPRVSAYLYPSALEFPLECRSKIDLLVQCPWQYVDSGNVTGYCAAEAVCMASKLFFAERLYDASLCGNTLQFTPLLHGVKIEVFAWGNDISTFFRHFFLSFAQHLRDVVTGKDCLQTWRKIKTKVIRRRQKALVRTARVRVGRLTQVAMEFGRCPAKALLYGAESLEMDDLGSFVHSLGRSATALVLVSGRTDRHVLGEVAQTVHDWLEHMSGRDEATNVNGLVDAFAATEHPVQLRSIILPVGETVAVTRAKSPGDNLSAYRWTWFTFGGAVDDADTVPGRMRKEMCQRVLGSLLNPHVYHWFRVRPGRSVTAYVVRAWHGYFTSSDEGLSVHIETDADRDAVVQSMRDCMEAFAGLIDKMASPDARAEDEGTPFDEGAPTANEGALPAFSDVVRTQMMKAHSRRHASFFDLSRRVWKEVQRGSMRIRRSGLKVRALRDLKPSDVAQFFHSYVMGPEKHLLRVEVHADTEQLRRSEVSVPMQQQVPVDDARQLARWKAARPLKRTTILSDEMEAILFPGGDGKAETN